MTAGGRDSNKAAGRATAAAGRVFACGAALLASASVIVAKPKPAAGYLNEVYIEKKSTHKLFLPTETLKLAPAQTSVFPPKSAQSKSAKVKTAAPAQQAATKPSASKPTTSKLAAAKSTASKQTATKTNAKKAPQAAYGTVTLASAKAGNAAQPATGGTQVFAPQSGPKVYAPLKTAAVKPKSGAKTVAKEVAAPASPAVASGAARKAAAAYVRGAAPSAPGSRFDFVIIDAGHGGKDGGATGAGGASEKRIALKIAREVHARLGGKLPEVKRYLTRDKDVFVSLEGRTRIANKSFKYAPNGLFVSIHCNSSRTERVKGFEVYYLSETNVTRSARRLAAAENKHLILDSKWDDVKKIESAMLMNQVKAESKALALQINGQMSAALKGRSPNRGVKAANLHVLRGSLMPAVLVEVGFITNPAEAAALAETAYIEAMAEAISRGVRHFAARPGR